ncbi:MAG: hypothetical protein ACLQBY_10140 [Solirubrobacteraceae bacterium]
MAHTMGPAELDSESYAPPFGDIHAGDICRAVALPDLEQPRLFRTDEEPRRPLIAGRFQYVVVVATYEEYATVVPVMVADGVSDAEAFAALVATGAEERPWMRLPSLAGTWEQDAIALLFMPHTLVQECLLDRRVAGMHRPARELVARRFARAFQDDGD